jgi:hypothetical protein
MFHNPANLISAKIADLKTDKKKELILEAEVILGAGKT